MHRRFMLRLLFGFAVSLASINTASASETVVVTVKDYGFDPAEITVKAGCFRGQKPEDGDDTTPAARAKPRRVIRAAQEAKQAREGDEIEEDTTEELGPPSIKDNFRLDDDDDEGHSI